MSRQKKTMLQHNIKSQEYIVVTEHFMSRQTQHEAEVNFVVTKTTIVTTEVEKNDKKIVATQKRMLRHNNELKASISFTTKENYVVTIKVIESEIFVTTKKFYVATENGK